MCLCFRPKKHCSYQYFCFLNYQLVFQYFSYLLLCFFFLILLQLVCLLFLVFFFRDNLSFSRVMHSLLFFTLFQIIYHILDLSKPTFFTNISQNLWIISRYIVSSFASLLYVIKFLFCNIRCQQLKAHFLILAYLALF